MPVGLIAHVHQSRIGKRAIASALLSQLTEAERLSIGQQLLTSTTDPSLFADLSAAARAVETAALRLARDGFEKECL